MSDAMSVSDEEDKPKKREKQVHPDNEDLSNKLKLNKFHRFTA